MDSSTSPTAAPAEAPSAVQAHLSLWDAVSLIIGIVIGAGIYETAPFILSCVASPGQAMAVWAVGGVLSVVGALCYAELATTYPRLGGDYYFLRRAFGPWAGFVFSWSQLVVIMSGSIGLMAFVFADYAVRLGGFGAGASPWLAAGAVTVISAMNLAGLRSGQRTQNLLTLLKAVGLTAIVVAGFGWSQAPARDVVGTGGGPGLGLALILVLYTYGGWNDAAFIVAEMKDKQRAIPRALLLGTAGVAVIYLLVNAAYLNGLGFAGARAAKAIAADVLQGPLGTAGAGLMSVLVIISALGAVNGLILTGARIYVGVGADYPVLAPLARWHERRQTPVAAIGAQLGFTLLLIFLVGHEAGRRLLSGVLASLGAGPIAWEGHGGFDTLLKCTAPVFWMFFLMTGLSLFVLRAKDRGVVRPFAVPLYPLLPLVFCGTCAYMLYSAVNYAGSLSLVGLVPVAAGLVLYGAVGRTAARQ
ncbi:MAG: amino acid permease [Verrucomicrobia bacterium]|nr:amino acid permease [Verrucomicrobiota bacterium]